MPHSGQDFPTNSLSDGIVGAGVAEEAFFREVPAGKLVDNDELRDALKENGIGRPSTRAAIIETLFKRHYIRKERKNLIATPTGIELVGLIREELLKSAELTGIWEKKLREIEKKSYDATTFLNELKQMVSEIVYSVLSDNTNRRVTTIEETATKTATTSTVKQPKKKAGTSRKNASSATSRPVWADAARFLLSQKRARSVLRHFHGLLHRDRSYLLADWFVVWQR